MKSTASAKPRPTQKNTSDGASPGTFRPLLRATLITLLAIAGGAALVGLITVIVTSLKSYTVSPADLLPARRTLVLFSRADEALLRRYEPWLPVLRSLPPSPVARTVAVVEVPDEGKVVAFFARRPLPEGAFPAGPRWTRQDIGPLTVAASSPALFPLLAERTDPLRSSRAYRLLSRGEKEEDAWIYAQNSVLPAPLSPADDLLHALVTAGTTHVSIFPGNGSTTTVRFFPAGTLPAAERFPAFPPLDHSFQIAVAHADTLWSQLLGRLTSAHRITLETRLLTLLADRFGTEVSWEYGLLPLLGEPARLTLARSASGSTSFLLQGKTAAADERLTLLHDAFRGSLTSSKVVTRVFDHGRYVFRNIRDDATRLQDEYFALGAWQAHTTAHTGERGLNSATNGENFLLSDDRALLEQAAASDGAAVRNPPAVAEGSFSRADLEGFFGLSWPQLLAESSPFHLPKGRSIRWTLARQGDVKTLTIVPQ